MVSGTVRNVLEIDSNLQYLNVKEDNIFCVDNFYNTIQNMFSKVGQSVIKYIYCFIAHSCSALVMMEVRDYRTLTFPRTHFYFYIPVPARRKL